MSCWTLIGAKADAHKQQRPYKSAGTKKATLVGKKEKCYRQLTTSSTPEQLFSLYIYTDAVGSNIVVTIMVNRVSRATVVCNGALYSTHDSEARFKVTGAPA